MPTKMLYSRESVRLFDALAIDKHKISSFSLMEKAGNFAFNILKSHWPLSKKIWIFCGSGNNAGDGFLVATLAKKANLDVKVILCAEVSALKGDASTAYIKAKDSGVVMLSWPCKLEQSKDVLRGDAPIPNVPDVIVDALFGTGLNKHLSQYWLNIIDFINNTKVKKLALDIPSGLDANTGIPMPRAIVTDVTATFVGLKQGLYLGMARDYCGKIEFNNLEIPDTVYQSVTPSLSLINTDIKYKILRKRSNCAHKHDFGHVVIIGGNIGMLGATIIAALGALRAGAGLVTVLTRKEHAMLISVANPEIMSKGITQIKEAAEMLKKAAVILIGPGLGVDGWAKRIFSAVLKLKLNKPLVIDADGLNLLAVMATQKNYKPHQNSINWILTPHRKEAARLLHTESETVSKDLLKSAKNLYKKYQANIVLKGAGSIVYNTEDQAYTTDLGNVGMASAGMGDLLSGIIAALVANGLTLSDAATLGMVVHAAAGDSEISRGARGMIATDLLPWVRILLN